MQQKVRLSDRDIAEIITSFKDHFGMKDHLWLFGSRVDLTKRGGDIDLYIETVESGSVAIKKKMKFVGDLWERIGEQKIDVVLNLVGSKDLAIPVTDDLLIYKIAKKEGVQLV